MKEIHWKNIGTGFESHGNPVDDDLADYWIKYGNIKCPYIYHWTVRVY